MSESISREEYKGDGIYGDEWEANKNETDNPQQANAFNGHRNSHHPLQSSTVDQTRVTNDHSSVQLNHILVNIEKQSKALDQLHLKQYLAKDEATRRLAAKSQAVEGANNQSQSDKSTALQQRPTSTSSNSIYSSKSKFHEASSHRPSQQQQQQQRRRRRRRQQQLDYYIKHRIRNDDDDDDECSCCYQVDSNDCQHLLNGLVGERSQPASPIIATPATTTTNCDCHECQHDHNDNVCLAGLRPSSRQSARESSSLHDNKQGYDSLFIERDLHHFGQVAGEQSAQDQNYSTPAVDLIDNSHLIELNNNYHPLQPTTSCSCCQESRVTFPSGSEPTRTASQAAANLEYSVLASSGYNYILGPASLDLEWDFGSQLTDSPRSETANALDSVLESHSIEVQLNLAGQPSQQYNYNTTTTTTQTTSRANQYGPHLALLSTPSDLEQPSEQSACEEEEEAQLDCSLTYNSSEPQDLQQSESICTSVGSPELTSSLQDLITTSAADPRRAHRRHSSLQTRDESTSIDWPAGNPSRSESNLASLLSHDCCDCCRRPAERRITSRDNDDDESPPSVFNEQLDRSHESLAPESSHLHQTRELQSFRKMGLDGNDDINGNSSKHFISPKASRLLGLASQTSAATTTTNVEHNTSSSSAPPTNCLRLEDHDDYDDNYDDDDDEANKQQHRQDPKETDRHHRIEGEPSSRQSPIIWPDAAAPRGLEPSSSMRAARDIAKMSAPSLSSLQYLPGKVDIGARRMNNASQSDDSNTKENTNVKSAADRSATLNSLRSGPIQQQHMAVGGSSKVLTDSKDDIQHEDSFLHRLCLCNCISHHNQQHQQQQSPKHEDKQARRRANTEVSPKKMGARLVASAFSCSDEGLTSADKRKGARRHGDDDDNNNNTKKRKHEEEMEAKTRLKVEQSPSPGHRREKQSKRFLDLLQTTSSAGGGGGGGHHKPARRVDGRVVGHGLHDDCDSERSMSPLRPLSALSATLTDDGSCLDGAASSSSPTSAKSGHSSDKQPAHKKTSAYKKFLSPSKLFGGSHSSNLSGGSRDDDDNHPDAPEPQSRSFLSRSLNRLSGRRDKSLRSKIDQPSSREKNTLEVVASELQQQQQQDLLRSSQPQRPHCASPTISISNTSQRDSPDFSDSINSLEDISLPHSLPVGGRAASRGGAHKSRLVHAPEIVLNTVEYRADDVSERSAGSDMARQNGHIRRNYHQHHWRRHEASPPPVRHQTSEYSGSLDGDSHGGGDFRGPFSLPSSPRSARRSRSPRLSQSPVAFRSPASESSKIEDGLRVCSSDHFEKHIGNIKENQLEAQKRLFTAWINHFCPNLIRRDLVDELQDGIKLIGLLASLTHDQHLLAQYEKLNRDKQSYVNRLVVTPSSRLKHLSNVSIAIEYLRKKLAMQLVNLNPMDIVSGKANVVLGLCWNIILHFQLEQNYFKYSDNNSGRLSSSDNYSVGSSEPANSCTSRLSIAPTNEDRSSVHSGAHRRINIGQMVRGTTSSLMDEYTTRDLLTAKNRLLDHINKRFHLKLTKLSSNLVDGDVLLVIIKHLLPEAVAVAADTDSESKITWKEMSDDEKLDHCFHLANKHLGVPRLFSASDLRQQSLSDNNSKPLLIYLSMLLNSNPNKCSVEQMLELRQLDNQLTKQQPPMTDDSNSNQTHSNGLHHSSGQSTVAGHPIELLLDDIDVPDKYNIDKLQSTLEKMKRLDELVARDDCSLSANQLNRYQQLKLEAHQVDCLINWINKADRLFETSQKSSADLAKAIEQYQSFFSPGQLPPLTVALCPTLERQYRECLATAKQRVLSMEQTMKNWLTYEEARQRLKEWLLTAESRLSSALRPNHAGLQQTNNNNNNTDLSFGQPIEQHLSRLQDLVDYFELEQIEGGEFNLGEADSALSSMLHPGADLSFTSMSSSSSLNIGGQSSLSGSLISLGSTSSRFSTLASSKKATYHRLFDDFELKCRLLAAMLDSDQRDALLLGVKELKSRLNYITEHRVPQVVNELRFNIHRCEMSIKEQDESCEADNGNSGASNTKEQLSNREKSQSPDDVDIIVSDETAVSEQDELQEEPAITVQAIKPVKRRNKNNKNKNKTRHNHKENNNCKTKSNKAVAVKPEPPEDPSKESSYLRLFWNKLKRASKVSISLNIVLLLCLAGICVVPLINRDACCELSQKALPPQGFSVTQRPT